MLDKINQWLNGIKNWRLVAKVLSHPLYQKYKDMIPYAFFGVLTTLLNTLCYSIYTKELGFNTVLSTILAQIVAVLFAYITNRKWVFHSTAETNKEVLKEFASFVSCRAVTFVIDVFGMKLLVDVWQIPIDDRIIKFVLNIVIILMNYAASKLIIFVKKEKE